MKYFISGLSEDQTNKVSMPMGTFSFPNHKGMPSTLSNFFSGGGGRYNSR